MLATARRVLVTGGMHRALHWEQPSGLLCLVTVGKQSLFEERPPKANQMQIKPMPCIGMKQKGPILQPSPERGN